MMYKKKATRTCELSAPQMPGKRRKNLCIKKKFQHHHIIMRIGSELSRPRRSNKENIFMSELLNIYQSIRSRHRREILVWRKIRNTFLRKYRVKITVSVQPPVFFICVENIACTRYAIRIILWLSTRFPTSKEFNIHAKKWAIGRTEMKKVETQRG